MGYSSWGGKESDTMSMHAHTHTYTHTHTSEIMGHMALVVKNQPANGRRHKRLGFNPWVGKIPWRRARQPTPVFLPGEFHGQRSLADYSPWHHKELDTTEHTHTMI